MKRLSLIILTLLLTLGVTACASNQTTDEEGKTRVYYLNSSGTAIVYETIELNALNPSEAVNAMVALLDRAPADPTLKKVKPDSVLVQDWSLINRVVTLNFTPAYSVIEKSVEILTRAAIVNDFCQIDGVDAVFFQVSGRPLLDYHGEIVGNMKAEKFMDILNRSEKETKDVILAVYFATGNENEIDAVRIKVNVPVDKRTEEIILEQLIAGPNEALKDAGFFGTIADETEINKVIVKNNICYIDFDKKFLDNPDGISNETKVYSIVNSITGITRINKVKITVEGEENKQITELETDGFLLENPGIIRE